MSLVRRRGIIQSEKFARKRRKKLIFAAVLLCVAIVSVCTTVFFFFRAQFVQIKSIEVSGPVGINGGVLSMVPAGAVQTEITRDLSGARLGFVSKNTLFTYPAGAIRAQLLKEYPAAQSIDFQSQGSILGFGNDIRLHIYITERSPFALACGSSCFYMDSSGFVYASAPSEMPTGNYIRYQMATSTSYQIVPGTFLTDPATFTLAQKIIAAVSADGLTVVGDVIGVDAYGPENQITISNSMTSTTATTTIYFNGNEPLDTELRYFSEFWMQEATSSAVKFQYVDMRYGKDIVFKVYPSVASAQMATSTKVKN